jgi:hypothetical protein
MADQPFKVIITFNRVGEANFSTQAQRIVTCLTSEPMLTLVPESLPRYGYSRAELQQTLDDYLDAAYRAKDSKSAIQERIEVRAALEQSLKTWGVRLELAAKAAKDITILVRSGYDLRRPSVKHKYNGIPAAPVITVKRGPVSGTVRIRVNPLLPEAFVYDAEYAVGPTRENAQFQKGVSTCLTGSRIPLKGLAVAQWHHFRVRGWGTQGPGDWSNVISFVVT